MIFRRALTSALLAASALFANCAARLSTCSFKESLLTGEYIVVVSMRLFREEFGEDICQTAIPELQRLCPGVQMHQTSREGVVAPKEIGNMCSVVIDIPPSIGECIELWLGCYVRGMRCVCPVIEAT